MQCATEVELWSNQTAKVNDTILIMAIRVPTASRAETKRTMGHESVEERPIKAQFSCQEVSLGRLSDSQKVRLLVFVDFTPSLKPKLIMYDSTHCYTLDYIQVNLDSYELVTVTLKR